MQQQGLLRRERPAIAETMIQVGGAELPERGIPCRAVARLIVRAGRDVPAFDNPLQVACGKQTLPGRAVEIARTDRDLPLILQRFERLQSICELYLRGCHSSFLPFRTLSVSSLLSISFLVYPV